MKIGWKFLCGFEIFCRSIFLAMCKGHAYFKSWLKIKKTKVKQWKPLHEMFSSYTCWIEINNNYLGLLYDLITTKAYYCSNPFFAKCQLLPSYCCIEWYLKSHNTLYNTCRGGSRIFWRGGLTSKYTEGHNIYGIATHNV